MRVILVLLLAALFTGSATADDDESHQTIAKALRVMFDYKPLAVNRNHVANRIHATDLLLRSMRSAKGGKQFKHALLWFEALDAHARRAGIYKKFDQLLDESMADLEKVCKKDEAIKLKSEWIRGEQLSEKYRFLVGEYARKERKKGASSIWLVNYLCELYQRDETNKIRALVNDFRLEVGARLVPGGEIQMGASKQTLDMVWRAIEKALRGHETKGTKKKRFWRATRLGFDARERRRKAVLFVPSFFSEGYLRNGEALELYRRYGADKLEMPYWSTRVRGKDWRNGMIMEFPDLVSLREVVWESRTELPTSGADAPTLGFQGEKDACPADGVLSLYDQWRADGKRRSLPSERQWELVFRAYDRRLAPNLNGIPPIPDVEQLRGHYFDPRPVMVHLRIKNSKHTIQIFDSPFGFVGGLRVGPCAVWSEESQSSRTGEENAASTGPICGRGGVVLPVFEARWRREFDPPARWSTKKIQSLLRRFWPGYARLTPVHTARHLTIGLKVIHYPDMEKKIRSLNDGDR